MSISPHRRRSASITSIVGLSDSSRQRDRAHVRPKCDRKTSSQYRDRSSSRYRSRSPSYDSHSRHSRHRDAYSHRKDASGDHTECTERYEQLEGKYAALKVKYAELNTAHTVLNKVHEALTQAIGSHVASGSSHSSSLSSSPPSDLTLQHPEKYQGLNRENGPTRFPCIKFWTQDDFTKSRKQKPDDVLVSGKGKPQRGNARLKEGENVSCQYVEEEGGAIVDGHVAEEIRKHLQLLYKQLGSELPETWGKVGIVQRTYVLNALYKKYPYLALCCNDWKADYLASRGLSSLRSTEKRRSTRSEAIIKTEVKTEDDNIAPPTDEEIGMKRKAPMPEPGPAEPKKLRLAIGSDSSPSLPRNMAPLDLDGAPARPLSPSASPPPFAPSITEAGSVSAPVPPSTSTSSSSTTVSATGSAEAAHPLASSATPPASHDHSTSLVETGVTSSATPRASRDRGTSAGLAETGVALSATPPAVRDHSTSAGPAAAGTAMPASTAVAPACIPASGDNEAPLVPDSAPKTAAVVNPISKLFGPPAPSTGRLDGLRKAQAAQEASKSKPSAKKEPPLAAAATEEAAASNTSLGGSLKKVTGSTSAKNLCYKEYLKSNPPLTTTGFEKYWRGLPREMTKRWNDASKLAKSTASETVVGPANS